MAKKSIKKVLLFSRVSTLYQEYEQQTKELYKEAYNNGYSDEEILLLESKESAIKYSLSERESLQKMLKMIDEQPIELVICRELSRLSRRPEVLYELRNIFIEHHIQLICCNPYMRLLDNKGKMDQTANIMFSLFSAISESEMSIKKERMREGILRNREAGKTVNGKAPFGYQVNKEKRFELKYPDCDIVKHIFEVYSSGKQSMQKLSEELKSEGHFKDIKLFSLRRNIQIWIANPIYYGSNLNYPAIVAKSLWEQCQDRKVKNTVVHPNAKYDSYLCKHILYSKDSGAMLSQKGRLGLYIEYGGGCSVTRLNIDQLSYDIAVELYKKYVANPSLLMQDNINRGQDNAQKLKVAEDNLKDNQDKIDRLEERIIMGNISEMRANILLDKLKDERQQLLQQRNEYLKIAQDIIKQTKEVFFNYTYDYDHLSNDEKRDIIHKAIRKIIISRKSKTLQQAEIYSNLSDEIILVNIDTYHHTYEIIKRTNKDL